VTWLHKFSRIRSLVEPSKAYRHPILIQCSTPALFMSRSTSIDFTENQQFPSLISLSPLITGHPRLLQQTWVRSSSMFYHTFNLPMTRSLGFGFVYPTKETCEQSLEACWIDQLADPLYKRYVVWPSCHHCLCVFDFRFCFTPFNGCFSSFPRGTRALSVIGTIFSKRTPSMRLDGGTPGERPTHSNGLCDRFNSRFIRVALF